jgi:homoserine kinase type II
MDRQNLFDLLSNWAVEAARTFTPLSGGTNNRAWLVTTENGPAYILRLTSGAGDLAHFQYEVALLAALANKALPFQLPLPLQTRSGELFVFIAQESSEPAIATLTAFIAGQVPERTISTIARISVALAQLDSALATIPASVLPVSAGAAHFLYGDLSHCHFLVQDPFTTVEHILEAAQARQICAILRQTQDDWETLSAQNLPQQVLHRDCGPGNVLMEREEVTAILDFEFAGPDRRLFDLCVALSWWPVRLMGTGREWELIDILGHTYTAHFPLTEEELLALPAALRMRDATSLVYRVGRYLAGLETEKTLQERVRHSIWRETWLAANRETLLQHVLTWS